MKAIQCNGRGDEGVLTVADSPTPRPAEGSIRIAVSSAGINRADLLQRRGFYPPPLGASEILGLECAGAVIESFAGSTGFNPGDRIMALVAGGGQAEEAVVHAGSILAVPETLSETEAGAFPEVYLTAYLNLFILGGLDAGMTALVHGGSGGVGTAAIQLINEAGARAIVTAGSPERCSRCVDLGAEIALDYRKDDFEAACAEATDGTGIDVILDCIGGSYLEKNIRVLGMDGRLVLIGLMGGTTGELDLRRMLMKRLQVIGSTLRALPVERKSEIVTSFVDRFGNALEDGRLRPVIDSVFPMERVAEAHRRLASGDAFGKVVLTIRDPERDHSGRG